MPNCISPTLHVTSIVSSPWWLLSKMLANVCADCLSWYQVLHWNDRASAGVCMCVPVHAIYFVFWDKVSHWLVSKLNWQSSQPQRPTSLHHSNTACATAPLVLSCFVLTQVKGFELRPFACKTSTLPTGHQLFMLQIIKFNLALSLLYQIPLTCNLVSYCQAKWIRGGSLMPTKLNAYQGAR